MPDVGRIAARSDAAPAIQREDGFSDARNGSQFGREGSPYPVQQALEKVRRKPTPGLGLDLVEDLGPRHPDEALDYRGGVDVHSSLAQHLDQAADTDHLAVHQHAVTI